MSVPTPPSNVTERVKATETAAERAVREGRASSFDLTDPAIQLREGDPH